MHLKSADLLRIQIAIGHLHADGRQGMLGRKNKGIALCLCQMHGVRLCHLLHIQIDTLDLVDHNGRLCLFLPFFKIHPGIF